MQTETHSLLRLKCTYIAIGVDYYGCKRQSKPCDVRKTTQPASFKVDTWLGMMGYIPALCLHRLQHGWYSIGVILYGWYSIGVILYGWYSIGVHTVWVVQHRCAYCIGGTA